MEVCIDTIQSADAAFAAGELSCRGHHAPKIDDRTSLFNQVPTGSKYAGRRIASNVLINDSRYCLNAN